ncbi:MAG TPA: response regulator [Burkholderiales bacterium]|jgi:diguanylate cyclase (GGDEF)-like protein
MGNATDTAEKRVLIVDDSKFVRTTFNRILRSSFVVLEAVDGDAAWKTIQEDSSIVMVFSDLDMPKLDGYGLLRLIRGAKDERIKKLPVIVISGSQDQAAQSRARQAGANDFISKSADAPDVLSRIEEMLRSVKPSPRPAPAAAQTGASTIVSQAVAQLVPAQPSATQEIATIKAAAEQPAVAPHDLLTGTLTSANLLAEARKHFSHARRHGGQLSVMAFRVDSHAEATRDAGKDVSEQVLARIAKMVQGMLRTEDSIGRVAEATFMIISAGAAASQMMGFARRLHAQLESAQVRHNNKVLKIRTSFGLASLAPASAAIEDLMKLALQRAQAAGSRPGEPIVGEPEAAAAKPAAPAAAAKPAAAVASAAIASAPTPTIAPAASAATPQNDVGRALDILAKADPKHLDDACETVLRGFLDQVVKVLAAREIAKVSI